MPQINLKTLLRYVRAVVKQTKTSLRARIPEKVIIWGGYVSNALMIAIQALLSNRVSESNLLVLLIELIVAAQLYLPIFLMDALPLFHYFALLAIIATGSFLNLIPSFSIYYYAVTFAIVGTLFKLEPVITTSPTIVKITTRVRRAVRKARIPRTVEEVVFSTKLGAVHIVSIAISLYIYFWKSYSPALIVTAYAAAAFMFFFLGIGVNPTVRTPKAKYSLTLLFVLRYPFLFRIANKMKMKIHPLTERAGVLIYELEYVARYLATLVWYVMLLPSIYLLASSLLPLRIFMITFPVFLAIPVLIYYYPFISLSNKARARKNNVEKELPIFLAYASALVSAGYTIYSVFKDLASGKGSELLKAFTNEAKYFLSLVEKQGMPELRALERFASTHPSSEFRNFLLGYMHQRQLGGNLASYMEQKLMEGLDALKRRMENYVNQIVTLTEIALTVLVLPTLPMIVGFIIAPDIVYNMLFLQIFVFVPAVGFMFYSVASAIQLEFKDEYKFTYVPSVIGAVIGLAVALFLAQQKLVAGISFIIGAAAFGYYIEYARYRRTFSEIEKVLPQIFRDLSELRQMMPIPEALNRMTKMGYPRNVTRILQRVAALRSQGIKLTEQPWQSRSWFWKFTQFLLGKIEESGGGTSELFRQLMLFFTEFNNIMTSVRGSLRIYEFVIYAIPAIFALVSYSTLGIFVAMTQVSQTIGISQISSTAASQLGAQFPQLMKVFQGLDPQVLLINDVIIMEMSFILGLLGGKVISGTVRDTRALAVAMILTAIIVIVAPQFVESLIRENVPVIQQNATVPP
jgi:pilus assembly protein TadC